MSIQVIDCDGHVEESPACFADPYWIPPWPDRRPRVVKVGERNAAWLIEGRLLPKLVGPGAVFFGTPPSLDGQPTLLSDGKRDPLGSIDLSDIGARIRTLDEEHIDLQVIFPSLFLSQPVADDMALENAMFRSWNSWIADVCRQQPD